MTVTISLAPSGELRLGPPSGRSLDVAATGAGLRVVQDILRNAASYKQGEERRGHIREFPTQHVVDTWLREDAKRQAAKAKEQAKTEAATQGINLNELEFTL